MTLREKILKTFIVTIREINKHGGPEKFFEKYQVGGMYYSQADVNYDENGLEIGTAMTNERLLECRKYSKNRLFVCADGAPADCQSVKINAQSSLGGSTNLTDAYNYGKVVGMQMNDRGVDWVLAPSIDMCRDHLMYLRAISDNPKVIADVYREVIRGIQDQGVCATAKHFPGLGTYFVNMHMAPGQNILPFDEWMDTYGYTYKEMIKAGVNAIMTTHVTLKSYDSEGEDGFYPTATFSSKLTTELLKKKLGFDGAVVTDALIMGGMATGDIVKETVQAFKAGADFLLWPPIEAADAIEEAINNGSIPISRLDDALERIGKMEKFRLDALEKNKPEKPDPKFIDKTIVEIAKHGMCLLRNEIELVPIKKEKAKNILIVDATDENSASSYLLMDELVSRGFSADVERDIYDVPSRVCWQSDIDKLQSEYDIVIFSLDARFVAQWSEAHMLIWASHLFDKSKKIIVNYGSPYFAVDYFPEDPTFIEMNCNPTEESVRLLVDGLLGELQFTGKCLLTERNHE